MLNNMMQRKLMKFAGPALDNFTKMLLEKSKAVELKEGEKRPIIQIWEKDGKAMLGIVIVDDQFRPKRPLMAMPLDQLLTDKGVGALKLEAKDLEGINLDEVTDIIDSDE